MDVIEALRRKDLPALKARLAEDPGAAQDREKGVSALQLACYLGFQPGVDALLAAGAEPDVHAAACLGDAARIRALVAKDRSLLEAHGGDGAAPLHLAAHFGKLDAMRALLGLGAGVDAYAGGAFRNTPLHAAAAGSQDEAVELLLAAGAKPGLLDKNGYAPLHIAAANGAAGAVKALLAAGADPRARGPEGKTPLDFARERGRDDVAALLTS